MEKDQKPMCPDSDSEVRKVLRMFHDYMAFCTDNTEAEDDMCARAARALNLTDSPHFNRVIED